MIEIEKINWGKGLPYPLGVSLQGQSINFALVSRSATAVFLCLIERKTEKLIVELPLSPSVNRTGDVWHISVNSDLSDVVYAYRVLPKERSAQDFLLDPYAKSVATSNTWGLRPSGVLYKPFGNILFNGNFDWENDQPPNLPLNQLIIYEMHVRAFTKSPTSKVRHPGTFLGVIEKIPHLLDLGINAVELLPVQEFNELEYRELHPTLKKELYNFWGYSTVNFFSPMNRYAVSNDVQASIREFQTMVKALHKHKIEVILDIVFNHTADGGKKGIPLSFKGVDPAIYYMFNEKGEYLDFSGCGNTFNANDPIVIEFILSVLRYWVIEMHVDGFRFDLCSALTRGSTGVPLENPPLIEAITKDPFLAKVKLIAEPWDAAGLYQVGNFGFNSKRWSEWNGKYRDTVRCFMKGSPWTSGHFAMRLCGSDDLYKTRGPCASVNFVTCHDGFSLADLVSYNTKHNWSNGEDNKDGSNDNHSWNCGAEGPTDNRKINVLREKQMKNFHLALMISKGIPMLCMGDEYGHTKLGNNNTWCHDDDLNWFQWDRLEKNGSFYRFYRALIRFRKHHSIFERTDFLTTEDVDWHGTESFKPDWNSNNQFVAFTLKDRKRSQEFYIAFNAEDHVQTIQIPEPPYRKDWRWIVNTANPSPEDFYENDTGPLLQGNSLKMASYSAIVLG